MQNAQVLAQLQRLAAHLQSVLQARGVIDRAVGILMSRTAGTEGEAMARLRALSQDEQQQLEVVAGRILEEAVRGLRLASRAIESFTGAALPSATP